MIFDCEDCPDLNASHYWPIAPNGKKTEIGDDFVANHLDRGDGKEFEGMF